MYKMHLDTHWDRCPTSWKNFTNYIEVEESDKIVNGVSEFLDYYLSMYNAKYVHDEDVYNGNSYVEFASKEDAVVFELRFR